MDEMSKNIELLMMFPSDFVNAYNIIRDKFNIFQSYSECFNIYNLIKTTNKVNGDIIEVGTFNGGSAKFISLFLNKTKKIYTFDTFCGLIDTNANFDNLTNSAFSISHEEVLKNLDGVENVIVKKGIFPKSAKFKFGTKFSFAHIDVDTYKSTKNSLLYIYPRMNKNGVILMHDYNNKTTPGAKKAIDEFFSDKKEHIIPLWNTQAMIIKI